MRNTSRISREHKWQEDVKRRQRLKCTREGRLMRDRRNKQGDQKMWETRKDGTCKTEHTHEDKTSKMNQEIAELKTPKP